MIAYAAGFITGLATAALAYLILRHEIALYRRATGQTIDLTHRSRS